MKNHQDFTKKLLLCSKEERLEYFKKHKVAHSKLIKVSAEVKSAIRYLDEGCFIFLVGPTGSGKTTLMEGVYNSLIKDFLPRMQIDAGIIPAIKVEAKAEYGRFDWKEHWRDCLAELNEPLIDYKILPEIPDGEGIDDCLTSINVRYSGVVLRNAFESAARNRGLIVCFKDEAHHFLHVPSARMTRQQFEILKSAASRSKSIFALFGTYDLLNLRNASGQLGRRTTTIHFNRYCSDSDEDVTSFSDAALSLLAHMPLQKRPIFSNPDLEICFELSLGCIGLLKTIFVATLNSILEAGQQSLSIKDVIDHELPIDVLDKISLEIVNGERRLKEVEITRQKVRLRMAQGSKRPKTHNDEEQPLHEDVELSMHKTKAQQLSPSSNKRIKRRKVERTPKRDPVGAGRKKDAA